MQYALPCAYISSVIVEFCQWDPQAILWTMSDGVHEDRDSNAAQIIAFTEAIAGKLLIYFGVHCFFGGRIHGSLLRDWQASWLSDWLAVGSVRLQSYGALLEVPPLLL